MGFVVLAMLAGIPVYLARAQEGTLKTEEMKKAPFIRSFIR